MHEIHFLIECPLYKIDRDNFLNQTELIKKNMDSNDAFIKLMSFSDKEVIKKLAVFIKNAFNSRRTYLESIVKIHEKAVEKKNDIKTKKNIYKKKCVAKNKSKVRKKLSDKLIN